MIIRIKAPNDGQHGGGEGISIDKVEWVMLELNGELVKPERNDDGDKNRRVELGSVQFDDAGAPTLIIGNHELKGTAIALKEPFAVLRKRKAKKISNDGDTEESKIMKCSGIQYEVAGIVKKKLMFDQYPKSIMR